jgi:ribosomal protein S18 acetylase RimI-like enzyme
LLKEFYDKKLGAKLFEHMVQLSKQKHQSGLWLYTWVGNHRAVAFYKKAGFEKVGDEDFMISPTHGNPNYIMWKKF